MEKSDDIKDLLAALAKAQGAFVAPPKDKVNPYFNSKYATLDSFQEATRSSLATNGLSVVQLIEDEGDSHYVRTVLGHLSGQWIASKFKLLLSKKDMQGLGSSITYAKRYALSALLNVSADEDDDGNQAVEKPKNSPFPDEWEEPKKAPVIPNPKPINVAPSSGSSLANDFENELKKYKIKFGKKYNGKTLLDIGLHNSKEYLNWLLKQSEESGKQPSEGVVELRDMVRIYEHYIQEKEASKSHLAPSFDDKEPWPEGPQ